MNRKIKKKWYLILLNILKNIFLYLAPLAALITAIVAYKNINISQQAIDLQKELFHLQTKTDSLNWETYRKTTRPYIYVESVGVVPINPPKNDLFKIKYIIRNIGTLPAKKVESSSELRSSKEEIIVMEPNLERMFSDIFPNQDVFAEYRDGPAPLETVRKWVIKNPYIHIHIRYWGMDGELHNYRTVKLIKPHDFSVTNELTDFD